MCWVSHVTHMHEHRRVYWWPVTCLTTWVMAHMDESCHTCKLCAEWVMSHTCTNTAESPGDLWCSSFICKFFYEPWRALPPRSIYKRSVQVSHFHVRLVEYILATCDVTHVHALGLAYSRATWLLNYMWSCLLATCHVTHLLVRHDLAYSSPTWLFN